MSAQDEQSWARLRRLEAEFLRPHRRTILLGLVGLLGQSVLLLPIPVLQGVVLDRLVNLIRAGAAATSAQTSSAGALIGVVLVASTACHLGRMGLAWWVGAMMGRASQEVVVALRGALHRKLMRLPMAFFDAQQTGRLMARVTSDVGAILVFLNSGFLQLINDLILSAGIAVLLVWLEWRLALVALVAVPLYAVNHHVFASEIHRLSLAIRAQVAIIYALLSERVSAVRVVRSFAQEDAELATLAGRIDEHRALNRDNLRTSARLNALATLISGLGTVGVVCLGAVLVGRGRMTVGELMAFYALVVQLYNPIVRLTQFQSTAASTRVSVERLYEIFDEPEPVVDRPGARAILRPRGRLEFLNVNFSYLPDGVPALENISLAIEPGETVGLIGPSGAGKSTLLALAPRLYDLRASEGAIRLDGHDLRDLRLADLRRTVALVPQQALLFEGTIRSNLAYANPDATERELRWALEASDLARTVDAFALGWDTPVGERGQTLSGGQRQRLALARSLLSNPAVLLLDDCTSALDAETEGRVRRALLELRPGRTTVIVSHKVASVRSADRIVVLEAGRITEVGTHADLVALGGYYASSFDQQTHALRLV
jgi:ABC-type multidrug transport system fused ATPase/permease subunit